ncbi:transcription elongation factor GreA [Clostridium fallax]|uniref:Transcription elongation factor GreA n=1 Tax=Clostridium fallax TaxID=1533 RepID=A0A1M4W934_9CLOT|nr:transcription elongation factor GreA [Clostridium fallax]SHE77719.1 transcription elongation factor GreA [Clostridium fallax]SQB05947.1 transcription elongation factor GreA [Clostridium fallax]
MYNYLTEESLNKLKEELEYRKTVVRFKINEELKEARAHGDLSENFEYKAAKKERAQNNGRMHYLEKMIRTANLIVDNTAYDEVGIGKKVTLRFEDDNDTDVFTIVTTVDADPLNNKVSIECPIGKVIYKKRVGDKVTVDSPQGKYNVIIEKIELD